VRADFFFSHGLGDQGVCFGSKILYIEIDLRFLVGANCSGRNAWRDIRGAGSGVSRGGSQCMRVRAYLNTILLFASCLVSVYDVMPAANIARDMMPSFLSLLDNPT